MGKLRKNLKTDEIEIDKWRQVRATDIGTISQGRYSVF